MSLLRRESSTTRWGPFQELREMSNRLNRVFESGKGGADLLPGAESSLMVFDWRPSVNISETDKAYLIKADLPEVKKEDIKLRQEDGVLSIEGERRQEKKEDKEKVHRVESTYGRFFRSFTLPADADVDHIEAVHRDGTLSVTIPKSAAKQARAQTIKVS